MALAPSPGDHVFRRWTGLRWWNAARFRAAPGLAAMMPAVMTTAFVVGGVLAMLPAVSVAILAMVATIFIPVGRVAAIPIGAVAVFAMFGPIVIPALRVVTAGVVGVG